MRGSHTYRHICVGRGGLPVLRCLVCPFCVASSVPSRTRSCAPLASPLPPSPRQNNCEVQAAPSGQQPALCSFCWRGEGGKTGHQSPTKASVRRSCGAVKASLSGPRWLFARKTDDAERHVHAPPLIPFPCFKGVWTHWDLNPGPSACEADVIPLHTEPSEN